MSRRSSRYSSPARRAARVSSVPPVAASWASRPLSEFSVEWNDDRVDPSTHSQFQPPSASRCSTNHAAMPSTSAPSQTPFVSVQALMQQSTSPPQYGRSSYSQRLFAARRSAVSVSTDASTPHSRSEFSDQVVAVHGWPAPSAASGPSKSKSRGEERAAGPLAVRVLQGEQPGAEPLGRDASAGRRPDLLRGAEQVPLDLPAQRGVGVEQPVDQGTVHHVERVRRRSGGRVSTAGSHSDPASYRRDYVAQSLHRRGRGCGLVPEFRWQLQSADPRSGRSPVTGLASPAHPSGTSRPSAHHPDERRRLDSLRERRRCPLHAPHELEGDAGRRMSRPRRRRSRPPPSSAGSRPRSTATGRTRRPCPTAPGA